MQTTSLIPSGAGRKLYINEVSSRDGFQMECGFIPTQEKIDYINQLSRLGFAKIEVTSFTSPKAIPALADADSVMKSIQRSSEVVYTALVPNVRGAARALECDTDELNIVMSVSETHNLSNLRMTRQQSFEQLSAVIGLAHTANVPVNVSLSCVFGCPIEGEIEFANVRGWVSRFADQGVRGVTLCDTTGMGYPNQVAQVCSQLIAGFPELNFTGHFHDTRSMGLANILAAVLVGVRQFDVSLGGIGGCPYAPGATGNVASEDVVHMLECMSYETGVNLAGLINASHTLQALVGHSLASQIPIAGHRLTRHPAPVDLECILQRASGRH